MPNPKSIFPYLSYVTAAGDEIVLSCENNRKWWECYGREGFGAPRLNNVTRQYADGETKTLSMIIEPREMVVQMVINGSSTYERDAKLRDIIVRLEQVGRKTDWGKLKLMRSDGKMLAIDCVYTGGLDEIVSEYPNAQQFELRFYSGNGYFYDEEEKTATYTKIDNSIFLEEDLYLSDDLYLVGNIMRLNIDNEGELFYPIVEIDGPASAIGVTNHTTGLLLAIDANFQLLAGQKLIFDCREHTRGITLKYAGGSTADYSESLRLGATLVWPIVKGTNDIEFYFVDDDYRTDSRIRYYQRYYTAL